ncbi:MAG TPA: YHYH protein, partial [Pirellulales bacterium]|nr:YHYH protein [Pirellulales bacterium]
DLIQQRIYPAVVQDRTVLADPGTNKNLGLATWRSFDLEFRTPFPEVDTLRVGAGFNNGRGRGNHSEFLIDEISLISIPVPAGYTSPAERRPTRGREELSKLVPLGGRWYYDPQGDSPKPPATFDSSNADRLLYLAEKLETPFADNTSAWLRKGYLDRRGNMVDRDRFVENNLTISFTATHLVAHTHGLPNHPTATFPDRWRAIDGNPNYIQEQDATWYVPLEPRVNSQHVAMKNGQNNDHALPMGPIGLAVNGVVFFNPFDHLLNEDAVWRLDRCCGHPAPNALYHYHKYPVCVKSPWADDGDDHSPLIGFAFDGFPVYGPYESRGVLAKNASDRPLNEFNLHEDDARGPHYHVTPGQFPHIIGGLWGTMDERNSRPRPQGGPGGQRPAGGPGGPGGPGGRPGLPGPGGRPRPQF